MLGSASVAKCNACLSVQSNQYYLNNCMLPTPVTLLIQQDANTASLHSPHHSQRCMHTTAHAWQHHLHPRLAILHNTGQYNIPNPDTHRCELHKWWSNTWSQDWYRRRRFRGPSFHCRILHRLEWETTPPSIPTKGTRAKRLR